MNDVCSGGVSPCSTVTAPSTAQPSPAQACANLCDAVKACVSFEFKAPSTCQMSSTCFSALSNSDNPEGYWFYEKKGAAATVPKELQPISCGYTQGRCPVGSVETTKGRWNEWICGTGCIEPASYAAGGGCVLACDARVSLRMCVHNCCHMKSRNLLQHMGVRARACVAWLWPHQGNGICTHAQCYLCCAGYYRATNGGCQCACQPLGCAVWLTGKAVCEDKHKTTASCTCPRARFPVQLRLAVQLHTSFCADGACVPSPASVCVVRCPPRRAYVNTCHLFSEFRCAHAVPRLRTR